MTVARSFVVYGVLIVVSCGVVSAAAWKTSEGGRRWRNRLISAWLALHVVLLVLHPSSLLLSNALVLGSAAGVGVLLQRFVPTAGGLVALAIAASIADVVSFSAGPTRWLLEGASGEMWAGLPYLAIAVRLAGEVVPVVGVGDLLLFATFFLGLTSLGVGRRASFGALACGLLVALAIGLLRGGAFGIPFMAAAVVLLLVPSSRRDRREG